MLSKLSSMTGFGAPEGVERARKTACRGPTSVRSPLVEVGSGAHPAAVTTGAGHPHDMAPRSPAGRPITGQGSRVEPGATIEPEVLRAATVVWLVVNAVNVLQAIGFATRPSAPEVNPALGLVIAALAIPATWALVVFIRVRAGWRFVAGPVVFDAFVVLMLLVDYVLDIEWRDPVVAAIQVPYLVLFFGSIVLMGIPMFRIDRRRWLVTVITSVALVASMAYAIAMGVG